MLNYRNIIVGFLLSIICFTMIAGCGSNKTTPKETHIYDNAKVVDLKNGYGTATIGKVSVLKIKSTELTQSALEDWYFNYVVKNVGDKGEKWNWAVIVYTDKNGVGTIYNGTLAKDVIIQKESKDDTWAWVSGDGQIFVPDKDNKHLVPLK